MANEEAEELKKKGNDAFKAQKWDEAIKFYNKAIQLDPTNAAYYSNRSGAWSSKGNHESALSDANKCLGQDAQFVKGYARKGKSLFDLDRWDEAEAAYNDGLKADPTNDGCKRGIADIAAARQRRSSSAGSRSSPTSGGGGFGGMGGRGGIGGLLPKIMDRFKKGGRMQAYMVILVAYYLFSSFTGRFSKKTEQSDTTDAPESVEYEDDEVTPSSLRPVGRQFMEADGSWISYLQAGRSSGSAILLLHRSSLSAETEYGAILSQLSGSPQTFRVIAPDRPCHGFSPCPEGGEVVNSTSWLRELLASQGKVKRLALAAAGKDAAELALAFARRRPEVSHIWLLAPNVPAPDLSSKGGAAGMRAWFEQHHAALSPLGAADVMRWAATRTQPVASSSGLGVPKLPKGCKVAILYSEKDKEDEELAAALQEAGRKPKVRNMGMGETVLDGLLEEVQSVMGDSDGPDADDE